MLPAASAIHPGDGYKVGRLIVGNITYAYDALYLEIGRKYGTSAVHIILRIQYFGALVRNCILLLGNRGSSDRGGGGGILLIGADVLLSAKTGFQHRNSLFNG